MHKMYNDFLNDNSFHKHLCKKVAMYARKTFKNS